MSLFAAELEEPKIGMWGKGLTKKFEQPWGFDKLLNKLWEK